MPQTTTIQRLDRLIHQLVRVRNRVSQDHMTDFGIARLARRQPDFFAGGVQQRMRIFRQILI